MFADPAFWIAVGQIIMIDILLGGDNAVVIALACRKLPPALRIKGILWGTAGAIVLRVILIFFALTLLAIPYLKIVGALLLVWIGIKLLAPDEDGHGDISASDKLWAAVKTIIVADLVMSVDNVIAIAGAAQGTGEHQMVLVIFGLVVSATNSYRQALLSLIALFVIGSALLALTDTRRAMREAGQPERDNSPDSG